MDRQAASSDESSSNTARSGDRPSKQLGRRRLLAAGATAAVVGVAGCAQVANYIGGLVLDDVNLFNETDRRLTGSITVNDPNDAAVLDESFEIKPDDEDDEDDEESGATYGDVLTDPGEYTVGVELDDDSAVDGATDTEATVDVSDPDEEHIVVVFGADDLDEAIGVIVIEEITDIADHVDN